MFLSGDAQITSQIANNQILNTSREGLLINLQDMHTKRHCF
jgi:hypothetical protein